MKKNLLLSLSLLIFTALILTGCSSSAPSNNEVRPVQPDAAVQDILQAVIDEANAALGEDLKLPMTLTNPLTENNCESASGLTAEEFDRYVDEGYSAIAAINTCAFELTLVKCRDESAAAEVKKLMAAGYDPEKWICVFPEQSFVVEAGSYVLLASLKSAQTAEAIQASFAGQFIGDIGSVNIFYEFY